MRKVRFHTLGCKLNYSETSTFARQFASRGYTECDLDAEADVVVVNSCAVTEQAQRKCRQILRRVRRENTGVFLVVVGCYAQLAPDALREKEGVQLVVSRQDKGRLADLVLEEMVHREQTGHSVPPNGKQTGCEYFFSAHSLGGRTRAFLKVQDGCSYHCTYCAIPSARGHSRSGSIAEIVREAEAIAAQGTREIVLTGVNTGDFGRGTPESFTDLLRALDEVEGVARYRISSIEPNLLSDDVLDFVSTSKRFLPHFHVPLQSGSPTILAAMKRRYTPERYAERIAAARRLLPDLFLGVDVIVGFPGESERCFEESYRFIEKIRPAFLHVFPYSKRPGTPAASMDGHVEASVLHNRAKRMGEFSERLHQAYCQRFTDAIRPVLIERVNRQGFAEGLTDNYIRLEFDAKGVHRGEIVSVRIGTLLRKGVMRGELHKTLA